MDSEKPQSSATVATLAWIEVNKKRLMYAGAGVIVLVAVVAIVIQQRAQREQTASAALSNVRLPFNPGVPVPVGVAEALLKVAQDYRGTEAASRALLLNGAVIFEEGRYSDAQSRFNELLQSYPNSPWVAQANYGVAAALNAQGQIAEATAKYEEVRRRFSKSSVMDEAGLALARLYAGSKPEEAFKLADEIMKSGGQNSGLAMEAGMLQEDLLKKNPELAKLREPVIQPTTTPQLTMTTNVATNRPMNVITSLVNRVTTNVQGLLTNRPGTNAPIQIQLSPKPAPVSATPAPGAATPPQTPTPAPAK